MSTRISDAALALLLTGLAGCGEAQQRGNTEDHDRIPCARGAATLARACTIERARRDDGAVLTIRHADGGFRRLLIARDGRGVIAADGAEPARVRVVDANRIDVVVGDDRYRLPATVRDANASR